MIVRTPQEIRNLFERWRSHRARTIVAVDHSNVRRWQDALGWEVSVADLGRMAGSFASQSSLRRFYCAADFGPDWRSTDIRDHSKDLITTATAAGFEVVAKRVKYIREAERYGSKCDLDIEIVTDLFAMSEAYDRIVLFSGDGDFMPALEHLNQQHGKEVVVIGAAGKLGREIFEALARGVVSTISTPMTSSTIWMGGGDSIEPRLR